MKTIIRVRPFGVEFADKEMKDAARASGVWIVSVSQGDKTVIAKRYFSSDAALAAVSEISKSFDNVVVKVGHHVPQFA